ncbi:MAG: RNA polymerase factor sigma-54 [Prevotellaceae bacterium]|jgi:RNA polymerase sigma-54 factor|nr:RNA polymerase factor sigma-54 [Prevotellaceae bacterium]
MLKQSLQQKMLQKLSPLQIQTIKLLELPTMQFEQRIKKELEENPTLEEGHEIDESIEEQDTEQSQDEFTLEDYLNEEDDTPSYKLQVNNQSKDEKKEYSTLSTSESLHQHLDSQLGFRHFNPRQYSIGKFLIGSIDDDGYLRRDLESISDDLAFRQNMEVSVDELQKALTIIQDFDPPGIGARDLQECLLIQLKLKTATPAIELAKEVIANHFDAFTKKHYDKIVTKLDISEEQLKEVIAEIVKLNPRPGSNFTDTYSSQAQLIIPDFILELKGGELQLSLNAYNIPELRVSRGYSQLLQEYVDKSNNASNDQEKEVVSFIKQKIDSAKWFIESIKQRQNTLLNTMQTIIDFQHDYFIDGDESKLKPMILKDIAERTSLDISTVSRVVNSKYIQTHFGIFPLKHFFSEGMLTDSGEEVSTREVKNILSECIANEDKRSPVTDEQLTQILNEKGYRIARRTVAKYREQLNISVARLRKEL